MVAAWPTFAFADQAAEAEISSMMRLVTEIRRFRSDQGLRPSQRVAARLAGIEATPLAGHEERIGRCCGSTRLRTVSPRRRRSRSRASRPNSTWPASSTSRPSGAGWRRTRGSRASRAGRAEAGQRRLHREGARAVVDKTRQRLEVAQADIARLEQRLAVLARGATPRAPGPARRLARWISTRGCARSSRRSSPAGPSTPWILPGPDGRARRAARRSAAGVPRHPHHRTNGKTSTARMTDALLRSRGLRTGRFTSPHLVSIRERIVVDGAPVSAERFVEATTRSSRTSGWWTSITRLRCPSSRCSPGWPSRSSPIRRSTWSCWRSGSAAGSTAQRRGRRGGGDYPDLDRPHQAARRHGGGDRGGEGRHHQAGATAVLASSRWPPPKCCCGTRSRWARRWPGKAWSSAC